MITLREATYGLYGAWRLIFRDRGAMKFFDCSLGGAIRSFWAAPLAYPGFLALLMLRMAGEDVGAADVVRTLIVVTIGYVIGWCAYPLTALPFCRWVAPEERALGFIIAYNWSQVPQTVLLLAVAAVGALHVAPLYVIAFVSTVAYLATLVYEWFIARIALDAGALPATALVLLDVLLGALLSQVTDVLAA